MERIKKALEKARHEREAVMTSGHVPRRSAVMPVADTRISYTQTRTIHVSHESLRAKRVAAITDNNGVGAAYKMLRTQVLQRMRSNNWNALAITSPKEGNGKTLTAVNLAISLAREVNHSVLLVDLDLRRPSVHHYFTDRPLLGISDYLIGDIQLSEILINPAVERLVLLPGSVAISGSSEMLSSPKMVQLVDDLKTRYPSRLILFDMPPLLSSDDVLAFSPYVDAVLLVIEEGATTQEELSLSMDLLQNTNFLGSVLNKSEERLSTH